MRAELSKREPVPFDRLRAQNTEMKPCIAQPKRAAVADPHVARPPRGLD